jgi:hypothetical protein
MEKSVDSNAVREIEAKNARDQAFLKLGQSIDSNCVGRIMVGGL